MYHGRDLRKELDEIASREIHDDHAMLGCSTCIPYSYDRYFDARVNGTLPGPAAVNLALRGVMVFPCPAHATPVRRFAWVKDVPVEAYRDFLEQNHDDAFQIEALRALLPPEKPLDRGGFRFL